MMASNVVTINNVIRYDVPDDRMGEVMKCLDKNGTKVTHEDPLKGAWVSAKEK